MSLAAWSLVAFMWLVWWLRGAFRRFDGTPFVARMTARGVTRWTRVRVIADWELAILKTATTVDTMHPA